MTHIQAGSPLPAAPKMLWENEPEQTVVFPAEGKIIVLGVPGAFTPPCSSQVPGYITHYDSFVAKGVKGIYIIAINDIFVVNAWKKSFDTETNLHFCSDSTGAFVKSLNLSFDAAGLLGNDRSKRFVLVVEDGVVKSVGVEGAPPEITVTGAEKVLEGL